MTFTIKVPRERDVLSGRGNSANGHTGNLHFRNLIRQWKAAYVSAPKAKKPIYSKIVVDHIKGSGGRFLKQDPVTKLWREIGEKQAIGKTRQALREGAPDLVKEKDKRGKAVGAKKAGKSGFHSGSGFHCGTEGMMMCGPRLPVIPGSFNPAATPFVPDFNAHGWFSHISTKPTESVVNPWCSLPGLMAQVPVPPVLTPLKNSLDYQQTACGNEPTYLISPIPNEPLASPITTATTAATEPSLASLIPTAVEPLGSPITTTATEPSSTSPIPNAMEPLVSTTTVMGTLDYQQTACRSVPTNLASPTAVEPLGSCPITTTTTATEPSLGAPIPTAVFADTVAASPVTTTTVNLPGMLETPATSVKTTAAAVTPESKTMIPSNADDCLPLAPLLPTPYYHHELTLSPRSTELIQQRHQKRWRLIIV